MLDMQKIWYFRIYKYFVMDRNVSVGMKFDIPCTANATVDIFA